MSARETLRNLTSDRHRALDDLVTRSGYFDHLEGYGRWLTASHAFHSQVYDEVEAFGTFLPVSLTHLASRIDSLERDLAFFSLVPKHKVVGCPIAPGDVVGALAVLYVAQGAALGARLLVTRARALGLDRDRGAAHLEAEARERSGWQRVLDALARVPADADTLTRMGTIGCRTFDAAAHHFGAQP
jgi:heme oxygenase